MSASRYITLSSSIPMYNSLLEHLEKIMYVDFNDYSKEIVDAVRMGYEKLKSYYAKSDQSNIYPIATSKFFLNIYIYIFKKCSFIYSLNLF